MSNTSTSETALVCANCGKEGSDVTNTCNKCKSVMYCNASCKKKHRQKHKKACERRVAELHDEKLFKQPPPEEDCPICFVRLPEMTTGCTYMACCGKVICSGCVYAFQSRATKQEHNVCPFCRFPPPDSDEEMIGRYEKRIELNDPNALYNMGVHYSEGRYGLPQNYVKALELWHRAAELGYADANYSIGICYKLGEGVEVDEKKVVHYWELAAMGGHRMARHNLGVYEQVAGNMDRALKHFMIAVSCGLKDSLDIIILMYKYGDATKDDYAKALRSYQACLNAVRSDQRDEAAAARDLMASLHNH